MYAACKLIFVAVQVARLAGWVGAAYRGRVQTIFLVGPTAVGKSAVTLELARTLGAGLSAEASVKAEIVSADSMQVYRGMDIGTAKPSATERQEVRHHLIDVVDVSEPFDVKRFVDLAQNAIAEIHARGNVALVVGGTGLYVRALRQGLFAGPGRDPVLRARLEVMPAATLFAELERVDPVTAARIDRHNPRRLVRALEVFYATGKPIGEMQTEWVQGSGFKVQGSEIGVCLDRERDELYARIERRIEEQIAAGWVEEVRGLLARGLEKNPTALQAAGYRELVAHLRGELTLAEAVVRIKTRTRQLARRQLTWFRREPDLVWVGVKPNETAPQTAARLREMIPTR